MKRDNLIVSQNGGCWWASSCERETAALKRSICQGRGEKEEEGGDKLLNRLPDARRVQTTRKRTGGKLFKTPLVPLVGSIIIPAESRYLKFFNKFIFKTFIWKFHFGFIKISTKKKERVDNAILRPIDGKVVKVFFFSQIFIRTFPFDAKKQFFRRFDLMEKYYCIYIYISWKYNFNWKKKFILWERYSVFIKLKINLDETTVTDSFIQLHEFEEDTPISCITNIQFWFRLSNFLDRIS